MSTVRKENTPTAPLAALWFGLGTPADVIETPMGPALVIFQTVSTTGHPESSHKYLLVKFEVCKKTPSLILSQ